MSDLIVQQQLRNVANYVVSDKSRAVCFDADQTISALTKDRDTLISVLKGCVVALEHMWYFDEYQPDKCTVCKECEKSITLDQIHPCSKNIP